VYLVKRQKDGTHHFEEASDEWMKSYMQTRTAPLERL